MPFEGVRVDLSVPHRVRGIRALKAVSSSLRLQILNLLFDRGPLSYTELMSSLKMNPGRDAGRFAYHLKFLLKADLVEVEVEARKYCLTELGRMVIDVADRVEKKALKPKGMLVRASRFALEEFDANKIASSLIREAKMPAELAQRVAKEAEKRLLKSKTKYLTAPLVRELVNAILIEKGLEEYRHSLTRLGLPVHEVNLLVEAKGKANHLSASIHETAGEAVLSEYMLLKAFPRDIADAHISGSIHVTNMSSWILEPSEIIHDLRFFFQNGLSLEKINGLWHSLPPPRNLESALSIVLNILIHSAKEIVETQTLEYFNVFLAPYIRGEDAEKAKEALRFFILNIMELADTSLGLELTIPDFVADKPAVAPFGKPEGKYRDFGAEAQLLASLVLDILAEESRTKPLFNPKIAVKIRLETSADERAKALLLKTHLLASEKGIVSFACLLNQNQRQTVFSGSGCLLGANLSGDWEIDTLRTGCLGKVAINLPRIAYESQKDKARFLELLRERLDMATRALDIKFSALKQHGEKLIPFLMQNVNGDVYFRLDDSLRVINIIGLKEAVEAFCEKAIHKDEQTLRFIEEIAQWLSDSVRKTGRRRARRLLLAMLPDFEASERLAQLDIDRYGLGKIRLSGTREKPFYSSISRLPVQSGQVSPESLMLERRLDKLRDGGSLTAVELGEVEYKPEELMSITKQIVESSGLGFFTFNRKMTYCTNCKKSWFGILNKCPSCSAISTLAFYDRYPSS